MSGIRPGRTWEEEVALRDGRAPDFPLLSFFPFPLLFFCFLDLPSLYFNRRLNSSFPFFVSLLLFYLFLVQSG